jgi:multisubunit Na+/H+ antiporter MnhG subunit
LILEELKNINSSRKKLREFGFLIGGILVVIAAVLFYYGKDSYYYFSAGGLLLIIPALVYPKLLLPLHKLWMAFSVVLGYFSTRLILGILFYLVITPMGLAAKLFGKDFLDRKIEKEKVSYWVIRGEESNTKEETERQF